MSQLGYKSAVNTALISVIMSLMSHVTYDSQMSNATYGCRECWHGPVCVCLRVVLIGEWVCGRRE